MINYRRPGVFAWKIIWALAAGRTILFWVFLAALFAENEAPLHMPAVHAFQAFGRIAFPEIAVAIFIDEHQQRADSLIPWIITTSVFFSTFVVAYLFRVFVVVEWLRYQSQAAKAGS